MTVINVKDLKPFILCSADELDLELCLASGQAFSWHRINQYWMNIFQNTLYILSSGSITEDTKRRCNDVLFYCHPDEEEKQRCFLEEYFRLKFNLHQLYDEWSQRDGFFARTATHFQAIRLMKQPSFESLLSFICSQNNGISRITTMVHVLKRRYGRTLEVVVPPAVEGFTNCQVEDSVTTPGQTTITAKIAEFPPPAALCHLEMDDELRSEGFGYRAPYIRLVARAIVDGQLDLAKLQTVNYETAWRELLTIKGIGPKVADCVALTGLGHTEAVPIDTHLWAIAQSHYRHHLTTISKTSTLTLKNYQEIGSQFRRIFGPLAGWAHLILFAAQIRKGKNNKRK